MAKNNKPPSLAGGGRERAPQHLAQHQQGRGRAAPAAGPRVARGVTAPASAAGRTPATAAPRASAGGAGSAGAATASAGSDSVTAAPGRAPHQVHVQPSALELLPVELLQAVCASLPSHALAALACTSRSLRRALPPERARRARARELLSDATGDFFFLDDSTDECGLQLYWAVVLPPVSGPLRLTEADIAELRAEFPQLAARLCPTPDHYARLRERLQGQRVGADEDDSDDYYSDGMVHEFGAALQLSWDMRMFHYSRVDSGDQYLALRRQLLEDALWLEEFLGVVWRQLEPEFTELLATTVAGVDEGMLLPNQLWARQYVTPMVALSFVGDDDDYVGWNVDRTTFGSSALPRWVEAKALCGTAQQETGDDDSEVDEDFSEEWSGS